MKYSKTSKEPEDSNSLENNTLNTPEKVKKFEETPFSSEMTPDEAKAYVVGECYKSVFYYFEQAFGLTPQPPTESSRPLVYELFTCSAERFEEIANTKLKLSNFQAFQSDKHLTWQQFVILLAYDRGRHGTLPWRMAVITGRGLGKSFVTGGVMTHYLFSHPEPVIMATAPTSETLWAALFKETKALIAKMNPAFRNMFIPQSTYIRRKDQPDVFFIRGKTADSVESVRGLHAQNMLFVTDEASGVEDEIVQNGFSTMTNEEKYGILISNFSGNDSLIERIHRDKDPTYIKLSFSAEESPLVDQKEIRRRREEIIAKGMKPENDRDYAIDILGIPPPDSSEIAGWYRFFNDEWIDEILRPVTPTDIPDFNTNLSLGVDPAGQGFDETAGVLTSFKWAKLVIFQAQSTSDSIASAIHRVLDENVRLSPVKVFVDAFGVGHEVGQIVLATSSSSDKRVVTPLLVGEAPEEEEMRARYTNKKAMLYDALRRWGESGGRIVINSEEEATEWRREFKGVHAKKTRGDKLQIMGKEEARRNKIKSPNRLEALVYSLNFSYPMIIDGNYRSQNQAPRHQVPSSFDRFSPIP